MRYIAPSGSLKESFVITRRKMGSLELLWWKRKFRGDIIPTNIKVVVCTTTTITESRQSTASSGGGTAQSSGEAESIHLCGEYRMEMPTKAPAEPHDFLFDGVYVV